MSKRSSCAWPLPAGALVPRPLCAPEAGWGEDRFERDNGLHNEAKVRSIKKCSASQRPWNTVDAGRWTMQHSQSLISRPGQQATTPHGL